MYDTGNINCKKCKNRLVCKQYPVMVDYNSDYCKNKRGSGDAKKTLEDYKMFRKMIR